MYLIRSFFIVINAGSLAAHGPAGQETRASGQLHRVCLFFLLIQVNESQCNANQVSRECIELVSLWVFPLH